VKEIIMFGKLFGGDPAKKLQKQIEKEYQKAMDLQRSGKIAEYAEAMEHISDLEKQLATAPAK